MQKRDNSAKIRKKKKYVLNLVQILLKNMYPMNYLTFAYRCREAISLYNFYSWISNMSRPDRPLHLHETFETSRQKHGSSVTLRIILIADRINRG